MQECYFTEEKAISTHSRLDRVRPCHFSSKIETYENSCPAPVLECENGYCVLPNPPAGGEGGNSSLEQVVGASHYEVQEVVLIFGSKMKE